MAAESRARVAVFMGGVSSEREVSLHSGPVVAEGLRAAGFEVFEAIVDDRSIRSIAGREIDAAFIALHGEFGEDGGIQTLLEEAGIPYVGSDPQSSRDAMDKVTTKRAFTLAGIATPAYVAVSEVPDEAEMDGIVRQLGPRVVVKPSAQGSSIGVEIVEREGLGASVEKALAYDGRAIVERFVKGRELTIGILGERTLPIIELKPHGAFFDYDAKYSRGRTDYVINPPLPAGVAQKAERAALSALRCLGCRDLARVDLMLDGRGDVYVLEVNTIPGFTETSLVPMAARAVGYCFPALCRELIEMAMARAAAAHRA